MRICTESDLVAGSESGRAWLMMGVDDKDDAASCSLIGLDDLVLCRLMQSKIKYTKER